MKQGMKVLGLGNLVSSYAINKFKRCMISLFISFRNYQQISVGRGDKILYSPASLHNFLRLRYAQSCNHDSNILKNEEEYFGVSLPRVLENLFVIQGTRKKLLISNKGTVTLLQKSKSVSGSGLLIIRSFILGL